MVVQTLQATRMQGVDLSSHRVARNERSLQKKEHSTCDLQVKQPASVPTVNTHVRWRSIVRRTSPWVLAAMRRREPVRHRGPRAMEAFWASRGTR